MYGRRKKKNHGQSGRMNYWTMTCAKANNKRKKSQRREKSTWGFWFAEMQFHWRKKPNGLESEREKKNSTLKCVLTRRIVFPIYKTHKSATTLLWKMLFHLFSLWQSENQDFLLSTVTETGGDRTEYTITTMNNINLIWTSALDRAKGKKWRHSERKDDFQFSI